MCAHQLRRGSPSIILAPPPSLWYAPTQIGPREGPSHALLQSLWSGNRNSHFLPQMRRQSILRDSPSSRARGISGGGSSENVAGLLCYAVGFITGIIFFLIDKRSFVKFHAAQSMVVFGGLFVIQIALSFMGFLPRPRRLWPFLHAARGCEAGGVCALDPADDQGLSARIVSRAHRRGYRRRSREELTMLRLRRARESIRLRGAPVRVRQRAPIAARSSALFPLGRRPRRTLLQQHHALDFRNYLRHVVRNKHDAQPGIRQFAQCCP